MSDDLTGGPTSKQALAAELRRLMLAAERRPGGPGRLKRSALARSVGVSASSLYAYLDGTTLPPTDVLDRLLDALDVAAAERGQLATARDAIEIARRSQWSTSGEDPVAASGGPPVPRQLPAPPQMFTGRGIELSHLDKTHDSSTVVITAIDGMAGIGKTALAVHAGHQMAHRFPDGQLFIDLHGFTEAVAPVEPGDALDRLLRALGLPGEQIPGGLEDRAGTWRSVVSQRRLLIVLDNAATEVQVAPLLPGGPGCLVLITSRRRLTGLDPTVIVSLDTLPPADAHTMFTRTAGEDRLAEEPRELVTEAVELCGRLPLAIRIAAARLRSHPTWHLADLVQRLRDRQHRLGELSAGQRSVTAALDLSYQHLSPDQQQAYRLLGLHPGPEFDAYATAALLHSPLPHACRVLDQLLDAHLLQEPMPGRYRFHDLTRAHAATRDQSTPIPGGALERLLDYYRQTAAAAMDAAYPYEREDRPQVPPAHTPSPELADPAAALAWLDTELPNLLAAARSATEHNRPAHVLHLSAILHSHLRTRGPYQDADALHRQALATATAAGDQAGQLTALNSLGDIRRVQGRHGQAADHFEQALRIAHATDNHPAELTALGGLGHVRRLQGRYGLAADHFEQALRIARATGNHPAELNALGGLGHIHRVQGRHGQAADHFEQALRIAHATDNHPAELTALNGLGQIHLLQRRYAQAVDHHRQALRIAHAMGNQLAELNALGGLGHIHLLQGRHGQAADHFEQALRIARATGHRSGELNALRGLGDTQRLQGRHGQAADHYQRLLDLAHASGNRNMAYEAWQGLGRLSHATGDPDAAVTQHEQALTLAGELGQPADQARAHDGLAHAHHALSQHEQARTHWQHALDILTSLGVDNTEEEETNTAAIRTHLTTVARVDSTMSGIRPTRPGGLAHPTTSCGSSDPTVAGGPGAST